MIQNRSNLNQENFKTCCSEKFRITCSCTCTWIWTLFLWQVDDQNTSMLDRIKNLPMLQSSQLHSSLQLQDRITEDPEPACVRESDPTPLAGKAVSHKGKALLPISWIPVNFSFLLVIIKIWYHTCLHCRWRELVLSI